MDKEPGFGKNCITSYEFIVYFVDVGFERELIIQNDAKILRFIFLINNVIVNF